MNAQDFAIEVQPRTSPELRIIDGEFDDVHEALSEYIEQTADCYVTRLDERPLATFKEIVVSVEFVECEAIPNRLRNWLPWGFYEIEWRAVRAGPVVDDESRGGQWVQRADYRVEAMP